MGTIKFIGSNSLEFVRAESITDPQTTDNRLYPDVDYFNKYFIDYSQKLNQSDDLWFQFRTNYRNFTFTLYGQDGSETPLTVNELTNYTNWTYYQVNIDISSLNGKYYVFGAFDQDAENAIYTCQSQCFEVKESHKDTLLLEWYGNSAVSIPMEWGSKTQELRIEGKLVYKATVEATVTVDSDKNQYFTDYDPIDSQILIIELVPDYLLKIMNKAIGHDIFAINGQQFTTDGGFDGGDPLGNTLTYTPNIELRVKDYENYSIDQEIEGDLPVIAAKAIKAASGFAIKASDGKAIKAT